VTVAAHSARCNHRVSRVAMLVRLVPVRLVEISRGGCRLECPSRLEAGTSGLLAVELAGLLRVDDIRIARCQPRFGAGSVFQVGAELLTTRRLGRRTIRMALGKIIGVERGAAQAAHDFYWDPPRKIRSGEVSGQSGERAPPGTPGRGS
jgi:hypothetical protein